MKTIYQLTIRNIKMFFKDKGMVFASMITPIILLILYATFLASVYENSFVTALKEYNFEISKKLLDGIIGGEIASSLLAVVPITVAFCSNVLMVQDKASGAYKDISVTPVKKAYVSIAYYLGSFFTTLIISFGALVACFLFLLIKGWYLTLGDVLRIVLDVFLLGMFGTAIASIVNSFLSTNGQASAVGTAVSAGYGFICGAYMPIAGFHEILQTILAFLPGTYGTVLLRNHFMGSTFSVLAKDLEKMMPVEKAVAVVDGIKGDVDCSILFFGKMVSQPVMYVILAVAILVLIGGYILINALKKRR